MDSIIQIIVALGAIVAGGIALLIRRASTSTSTPTPTKSCCSTTDTNPPPSDKPRTLRDRLESLLNAIDYLRTQREWRYRTPWVLQIGESASGKTSALASVSEKSRQTADWRQQALTITGTDWRFFAQGVLIDPNGRLPAALPGSTDAKTWASILDDIDALRPERPIDGLVLAVSARTLLSASAEQRRAIADNAFSQLDQIQQRFEFILPVYVTVTEADTINGFTAFWSAQPTVRQTEMFGWSAPASASSGTPEEWANSAFDIVGEQLKSLQVDAAAGRDQIADVDHFFLFPRHFQQLRAPLKEWLTIAFQSSAWKAGFLCRGIYFTGSLAAHGEDSGATRSDVAFVDDLVTEKILAEPHLARPTRQGIWSRNKLIRALQLAGVATFCGMVVSLAMATTQLNRQVDALISSLKLLEETRTTPESGEACIAKENVYDLLAQVARIDADSMYLAIPVSWIDSRATRKSTRMIGDAVLQRVVLPGLGCQLEQRARELVALTPKVPDKDQTTADAYKQSRQALFDYLKSVQTLEANLDRFHQLAMYAPQSEKSRLMQTLTDLASYAYGTPLPTEVMQQRGALAAALAQVKYAGQLHLPVGMHQRFTNQIVQLSTSLRTRFGREVQAGDTLLAQLTREQEPILDNTKHFTWWLTWVRQSWLGSTPETNPCEEVRVDLHTNVKQLVTLYKYSAKLEEVSALFNTNGCYKPSMNTLTAMQLAPYGALFTRQNNVLQLNPALVPEANGLTALVGLNYMQVSAIRPFACQASTAGWHAAEITQAANYAQEYQRFAKAQGLPATGADAGKQTLYDRLAQHQLELAMSSSLRDAQLPPPDASPVQKASLDASSLADQTLAQQSSAFSGTVDSLLGVLRIYSQHHFKHVGDITECVRNFSSDSLAHISALVSVSRLYDPDANSSDEHFFNLGTTAVTKDYLARQVARSQVLAGYATPFVNFLQNTNAVNDAQKTNDQTAPYWNNTITEINRYVQFKEPNGQVAQLDNVFLKQFADLTSDNCDDVLDTTPPEYGNDLFSDRRKQLEDQAHWQCDERRNAQAYTAYRDLSNRFNRDLAGRYPFGDMTSRDASLATVKAFFSDYAMQSAALRKSLTGLSDARWVAARRFLDQLDTVSSFFSGTLVTSDSSQPVKLTITFRAQATASPGSEQVVNWSLTSGTKSTGYPNRANTLDWPYGQALVLDVAWASGSVWRPSKDLKQTDLQIDGNTASFAASGNWALLRMISAHPPQSSAAIDPLDPSRTLLEFDVPVVLAEPPPGKIQSSMARLYLGLNLSGKDVKTQTPVPLTLPPNFPRLAPQ